MLQCALRREYRRTERRQPHNYGVGLYFNLVNTSLVLAKCLWPSDRGSAEVPAEMANA